MRFASSGRVISASTAPDCAAPAIGPLRKSFDLQIVAQTSSTPSECTRSTARELLLKELLHQIHAGHPAGFFHHHTFDAVGGLGVALAIILRRLVVRRDGL